MKKVKLHYVGHDVVNVEGVLAMRLDRIGQVFELPEDQVKPMVYSRRGIPALCEECFAKVGFTADELAKYGPLSGRLLAPASFHEKAKKAIAFYTDLIEDPKSHPCGCGEPKAEPKPAPAK